MEIIVYGKPSPQGSKKYVGKNSKGAGIILNTSPGLIPWRNEVCLAAERELDRIGRPAPFSGPVQVIYVFTFMRPKSTSRSKRLHPSVAPDLSKIVRATEDALTDAGVWKDDALVVDFMARKRYANEDVWSLDRPGARIEVTPVVPLDLPPGRGYLELEASHEG
jgi:Holliday junction resolvase RusA-like endonuclease